MKTKLFLLATLVVAMVGCDGCEPDPVKQKYVDLGLSVKWATCNIGANSPEEFGDYFAWGEVKTKKYYRDDNYKWGNYTYNDEYGYKTTEYTKYCINSNYGDADYKTRLDDDDDAAVVNLGGKWRMPTFDELNELLEECTWKKVYKKGTLCYEVIGPNGNSIILPAGGRMIDDEPYDDEDKEIGVAGWYWTSTLSPYSQDSGGAYILWFDEEVWFWESGGREQGLCIRPVCP